MEPVEGVLGGEADTKTVVDSSPSAVCRPSANHPGAVG